MKDEILLLAKQLEEMQHRLNILSAQFENHLDICNELFGAAHDLWSAKGQLRRATALLEGITNEPEIFIEPNNPIAFWRVPNPNT